jgi:tRNA (guanine9-N1)-methyltransferase
MLQGIRMAKLPIRDHLRMVSTHVLTVNHVFDILLNFQSTGDWASAISKVLPQRKEATPLSENLVEVKDISN